MASELRVTLVRYSSSQANIPQSTHDPAGVNEYMTQWSVGEDESARERRWVLPPSTAGLEKSEVFNLIPTNDLKRLMDDLYLTYSIPWSKHFCRVFRFHVYFELFVYSTCTLEIRLADTHIMSLYSFRTTQNDIQLS